MESIWYHIQQCVGQHTCIITFLTSKRNDNEPIKNARKTFVEIKSAVKLLGSIHEIPQWEIHLQIERSISHAKINNIEEKFHYFEPLSIWFRLEWDHRTMFIVYEFISKRIFLI